MYDPTIGRWLSEDPIGLAPDTNPYRYVRNNPVNLTDPSGLAPPADDDAWPIPDYGSIYPIPRPSSIDWRNGDFTPDQFVYFFPSPGLDMGVLSQGCVGLAAYRAGTYPRLPNTVNIDRETGQLVNPRRVYGFVTERAARQFLADVRRRGEQAMLMAAQTANPLRQGRPGEFETFDDPNQFDPRQLDLSLYNFASYIERDPCTGETGGTWEWVNYGWRTDPSRRETARVRRRPNLPSDDDYNYSYFLVIILSRN